MFEDLSEIEKKALSNAIEHRIILIRIGKGRAGFHEGMTYYEMDEKREEELLMDISTRLTIGKK